MSRVVMIVDDEPDIRAIVGLALERLAGWEVIAPEDGEEALVIARERRPDAILLDLMMPVRDGLDLARVLGSDPATAGIPLLLLTATATDIVDVGDAPISAILTKPFDPLTLAQQIREALEWQTDSP